MAQIYTGRNANISIGGASVAGVQQWTLELSQTVTENDLSKYAYKVATAGNLLAAVGFTQYGHPSWIIGSVGCFKGMLWGSCTPAKIAAIKILNTGVSCSYDWTSPAPVQCTYTATSLWESSGDEIAFSSGTIPAPTGGSNVFISKRGVNFEIAGKTVALRQASLNFTLGFTGIFLSDSNWQQNGGIGNVSLTGTLNVGDSDPEYFADIISNPDDNCFSLSLPVDNCGAGAWTISNVMLNSVGGITVTPTAGTTYDLNFTFSAECPCGTGGGTITSPLGANWFSLPTYCGPTSCGGGV